MVDNMDRLGQKFGEYRLLRWLGGGGYGDVYLAEHIYDHTQVAIKILNARLSQHKDLEAFINEARTMRLKHPHIVPLLDFGIGNNNFPFLVMEYAPHGTLRTWHPKGSQLPLSTVLSYVTPIASALQYAHDLHLVHRDVKPENILVGATGEILLSDFGIATAVHNTVSSNMQKELEGTIPYMAPEQLKGKPRPASDQYSLGIVVYEWLCGKRPFEGTIIEVAQQHTTTSPPSLHEQLPLLPGKIEQVVLQALAKDPNERFESVQSFASELAAVSQSEGISTIQPVSTPPINVLVVDEEATNKLPRIVKASAPCEPTSSQHLAPREPDTSNPFRSASSQHLAPLEPDTSDPFELGIAQQASPLESGASVPGEPASSQQATPLEPDASDSGEPGVSQQATPHVTVPAPPVPQPTAIAAHTHNNVKKGIAVAAIAVALLLIASTFIYTTHSRSATGQPSSAIPTTAQQHQSGNGQVASAGSTRTPIASSTTSRGGSALRGGGTSQDAPISQGASTSQGAQSTAPGTAPTAGATTSSIATATPTPTPLTTNAVDGQDPTTYTVNGQTCAATLSSSYTAHVALKGITGTLYFEFSATCQAAWAEVIFNRHVSAGDGNAKIVRNSDGQSYTCDVGATTGVTLVKTSCYTAMVHDTSPETASAYAIYTLASSQIGQSAALGPY